MYNEFVIEQKYRVKVKGGHVMNQSKSRIPIVAQIVFMFIVSVSLMAGVVGYTYYHLRSVGAEAQKVIEEDALDMVAAKDAHTQFTFILTVWIPMKKDIVRTFC